MDTADFGERARREAERYGADPWVFLRELLQNARDAGARRVDITVSEHGEKGRLAFRDDGVGMSFEHARRYLFTLYASSKEGERGAAGRFGVGFWSILRFEPDRIRVRSWPARGAPWEVELDGQRLDSQRREPPRGGRGTEIVLERGARDRELPRRVRDAVWQSARYLCRRDDPRRPLQIRVNGEPVAAPFELPPPSARFRKGRLRGAVGLGPEARVELFAQGLRVRSASALEDLLSPNAASGETRVRFPPIALGVAPQAILDGEGLEPLLSRSDVRDDPALRRLVRLARAELRRLVERQLDALRPQPFLARARPTLAALAGALALAGAAIWSGIAAGPPSSAGPSGAPTDARAPSGGAQGADRGLSAGGPAVVWLPSSARPEEAPAELEAPPPPAEGYRDLGGLYQGPSTSGPQAGPRAVVLRYSPASPTLFFAALVLRDPLLAASVVHPGGPYLGRPCSLGCTEVTLALAAAAGPLRLPIPTGHRLDTREVLLDGRPVPVFASEEDEPVIVLARPARGVVRYRTGPAPEAARSHPFEGTLPPALRAEAERLRGLPRERRVAAATEWVRSRILYSAAAADVEREKRDVAAGWGVLESALASGKGDCDVQNAALALLLQASGIPARMAVGLVGERGVAGAPFHAWVEQAEGGGPWRVVDASLGVSGVALRPGNGGETAAAPRATMRAPIEVGSASVAPRPLRGRPILPTPLVAAAVLGFGLVLVGLWRARPRSEVRLDPSQDLARLIQGALQQPDAFRHAPALFHRRLLPCWRGRRVSLGQAWDLAATGGLYASSSGSALAERASRRGGVVLDTRHPEARAVADALGARDLDEWQSFLVRARTTGLLGAVDARMRRLGAAWEVRVAAGVGPPAVLDLPGRSRVVVLDETEGWLLAAEARFRARPEEAVFDAVDRLADVLGLEEDERGRLLSPLAREAVREAAREPRR